MEFKEKLTGRSVRPWATLAIALMAVMALMIQTLAALLIYDRMLILQGQVWRGWSGHVVHHGLSHLFWNLAVFLPAGCWLECLWPRIARWFFVACPLAISIALLIFEPTLMRYAGLSGLATGTLVLLAGLQLRRRQDEPAWFWLSVLALIGTKIGHELITGAPLIVSDFAGIRSVPLAHISGLASGIIFWGIARSGPLRSGSWR